MIYAQESKQLSTFSLKIKHKIDIVALFALTVKKSLIKKQKYPASIIAVNRLFSLNTFTIVKDLTILKHAKNAESSS